MGQGWQFGAFAQMGINQSRGRPPLFSFLLSSSLLLTLSIIQGCVHNPALALSTGVPTRTHWAPVPKTSWQIQLQGEMNRSIEADIYVIDLFDTPQPLIDELHAADRHIICYFSAGSWEEWRFDADKFPAEVIGEPLADWPGEYWLDIRHIETRQIMGERMDLAAQKGCDGVDPDNVDAYTHNTGFALTSSDQLDYNRWLAVQAHQRNLAVGLKNDMGQIPQLVADFDWVINEQCFAYNECELLQPFLDAGKPVFNIEYTGDRATICQRSIEMNFDTLFKTLDLLDEWFYCPNEYPGEEDQNHEAFLPFLVTEIR